jgi:hypothetical protein
MAAKKPQVEVRKLSELRPDTQNANLGTQRGQALLEQSLQKRGAGRSVLADKHGNLIAGNKTWEKAGEAGFQDVIVVKTDGTQLVVVQREDLDLYDPDDPRARELAYDDNRVAQEDLAWNATQIAEDIKEGRIDLSEWWRSEELEGVLAPLRWDPEAEARRALENGGNGASSHANGGDEHGLEMAPASHVRMVQLFFNTNTQPEFMQLVERVAARFGTTNPTDTVLEVLRYVDAQPV